MSVATRVLRLTTRILRDNDTLDFTNALNQAVNESAPVFNVSPVSCYDDAIVEMASRLDFDVAGLAGLDNQRKQDYLAHLTFLIHQTPRNSLLFRMGRV